jgi:hypothetical protein
LWGGGGGGGARERRTSPSQSKDLSNLKLLDLSKQSSLTSQSNSLRNSSEPSGPLSSRARLNPRRDRPCKSAPNLAMQQSGQLARTKTNINHSKKMWGLSHSALRSMMVDHRAPPRASAPKVICEKRGWSPARWGTMMGDHHAPPPLRRRSHGSGRTGPSAARPPPQRVESPSERVERLWRATQPPHPLRRSRTAVEAEGPSERTRRQSRP